MLGGPSPLAGYKLPLLQNDNPLLIYSRLISPLIRGLVKLMAWQLSKRSDDRDGKTGGKNGVALGMRNERMKGGC